MGFRTSNDGSIALCRPGITSDQQIATATGQSPLQVEEAIQTLLSRYYIHILPSGGYMVW
jgi:hypothetical protein